MHNSIYIQRTNILVYIYAAIFLLGYIFFFFLGRGGGCAGVFVALSSFFSCCGKQGLCSSCGTRASH